MANIMVSSGLEGVLTEGKLMKIARTLLICAFILSIVAAACALNPDRDIHQLAHRSWGEKEGYPGRAQALAQTADGFLWIGTDIGLFRFDGIHFERFVSGSEEKLSEGVVAALLALRDGSLWIAYRYEHKISVLRNGKVKSYNIAEGVTSNPTAIVQDQDGILWANTPNGLIRFNGKRWERVGRDWNVPKDAPHATSLALFVDSRGTLWAGVNQTVLYLKRGSKRFEPTGAIIGLSASISEAPDGTLWLADNLGYILAVSASVSAKSAAIAKCQEETSETTSPKCVTVLPQMVKISNPRRLLFDRNGSLWVTTDSSGLGRVPYPEPLSFGIRDRPILKTKGALQKFTSKDGLSADNCTSILEDREGNIWVATRDGLDQFRETALVPVVLPASIVQAAIAPADGGDIWVAGSSGYVARTHGSSRDVLLFPGDAYKLYRDRAGVIWLMGNSLGRWKDGEFRKVADSPYSFAGSIGNWQIAGDRSGTLWAFFSGHGFFSLDHGRWKAWATPPEVAKRNVSDMFSDSTGRIWVSAFDGGITSMDHGNVVDYPAASDSPLFSVRAFAEHSPQQIWAGGSDGLVLIEGGRLRSVKPLGIDSFNDVYGIVDTGSDGLWLSAAGSVLHISKGEIDRALQDPTYRFHWERFDSFDGLPGQTESIFRYPKAIQGTDGRIWFTALRGVAWVDPKKKVERNALPPPVSITFVSADGSGYMRFADLRLPAHTTNVQIDYSALSLSVPERVRFRYKLEGIDRGWQDVGTRRRAYYNNLGPGSYHFRVIACNNDGVWNEVGSSLDFSIRPAWYQTDWFRTLCGLSFLLLIWAIYQLRLRQLQHQFTIGLEARVNERTRVARDLHDTMLQSFQGAVFQFQAARKLLLRNADNAMQVIDEAIQAAEEGITEGRAAIHDLRPEPAAQRDLPELINAVGRELATAHEPTGNVPSFGVVVEGKQQSLSPMIQDEIYRISREVIRNAFAHAAASRIETEIRYDTDQLRLRVRDDGKGIDSKLLEAGGRAGHFGIPGMRERAQRIGAQLKFWTEVGAGTEVELTVPAAMAYQKRPIARRFRLFRGTGHSD